MKHCGSDRCVIFCAGGDERVIPVGMDADAIDIGAVGRKVFIAIFESRVLSDQQEDGHADRQAEDINGGIGLVPQEVPDTCFEVVEEHSLDRLSLANKNGTIPLNP